MAIRRYRSLAILAAIALLWMGVDWESNGCDPDYGPRAMSSSTR